MHQLLDSGEKHPMTEEKRRAILLENKAMADQALRVLAAAQRSWGDTSPEDISPRLWNRICASSALRV